MKRVLFQYLMIIPALALLGGCTQDTAQGAGKVLNSIKQDWIKTFGTPVQPKDFHLYNFDTFVCDGTRQVIVSFNPDGSNVSIMYNRVERLLSRVAAGMPFTDGTHDLYIMPDGTLLVEKHFDVLFKHCRPLVNDPVIAKDMEATGAAYDFEPTISPQEAKADMIFREHVRK